MLLYYYTTIHHINPPLPTTYYLHSLYPSILCLKLLYPPLLPDFTEDQSSLESITQVRDAYTYYTTILLYYYTTILLYYYTTIHYIYPPLPTISLLSLLFLPDLAEHQSSLQSITEVTDGSEVVVLGDAVVAHLEEERERERESSREQ
jgi:hypothetical protein